MSDDPLRNTRLQHWLNEDNSTSQLKIDGAAAADDDNESGYSSNKRFLSDDDQSSRPSVLSLRSDRSKRKKFNLKKLKESDPLKYQTWQRLQEERKRLQIEEERFLADLSPDLFPSDDDQSSCTSVLSLRSDMSKGEIMNFKKIEKSDPNRMEELEEKEEEEMENEENEDEMYELMN